jgi:uroporphyrinogen decarboxylase
MHFPNRDRMPRRLAELTAYYQEQLDLDFVKYQPFGMHSTIDWGTEIEVFPGVSAPPVACSYPIQKPDDWYKITPRRGIAGEYAVILESQRLFREMRTEVVPFIQTVFSPMTTALKLAGETTLLEHLRTCPDKVKRGLEVITETTIEYVNAAVCGGADGVFFATQMSIKKITAKEHAEFVKAYDLAVLNSIKGKTWFNILHVHGKDTWITEMLDYPVQVFNWHDRDDGPGMAEFRKLEQNRAFVGGLSHLKTLHTGTEAEVKAQVDDTWADGNNRGVILGPGCIAHHNTPWERLLFIRKCVEATAR